MSGNDTVSEMFVLVWSVFTVQAANETLFESQSLCECKKGSVPVVPFPVCLSFISHEHYKKL